LGCFCFGYRKAAQGRRAGAGFFCIRPALGLTQGYGFPGGRPKRAAFLVQSRLQAPAPLSKSRQAYYVIRMPVAAAVFLDGNQAHAYIAKIEQWTKTSCLFLSNVEIMIAESYR
jgi:hypothetical protein